MPGKKIDLQYLTPISKLRISEIQEYVTDITDDKEESHQGKLSRLSKESRALFSDVQAQGNKVFNKVFIFGLGAKGPNAYIADKAASNDPYDKAKADTVSRLRALLDALQQKNELAITSEFVVDIIQKLHDIKLNLDNAIKDNYLKKIPLTTSQKLFALFNFSNLNKGGKIGDILRGNKYKTLLLKLAELYVLLKENERYKKFAAQRQAVYAEPARLFRYRPERQLVDFQVLIAKEEREEKRLIKSGKNLMARIEDQKRFELTGISRETINAEKKFDHMLTKTFAARVVKTAEVAAKPAIIDHRDHKHSL